MNPRIQMQLLKMNMQLDTACFRRGITLDADYPKDPDPKNWRTIQGAHVHLSKGKIDGGAGGKFHGKQWNGKQWHQFTPSASKEYKPEEGKQFTEKYQSALNEISKIVEQSKKGKGKSSYYQKKIDNVEEKMKTLELFNEKYKDGQKVEAQPNVSESVSKFEALSSDTKEDINGIIAAYKLNNSGLGKYLINHGITKEYGIPSDEILPKIQEFKDGKITGAELKEALADKILKVAPASQSASQPAPQPAPQKTKAKTANAAGTHKSSGGFGKEFNAYDLSEKNIGWKLPKGTQLPFENKYGDEFEAYDNQESDKIKQLNPKQQLAIWRYTAGSGHLRDWLVYGRTDPAFNDAGNNAEWMAKGLENPYKKGMTGPAMQKVADDISKGLKKIKHADIVVDRKCSLMDWATKDNPSGVTFEKLQEMAKSGEVFENKAFLSCSPVQGSTYGDGEAVRHIFVPKKAPGAYINGASAFDNEKEFLLDKGSKTRIMKVEKDNNGKIHIYEEVVL